MARTRATDEHTWDRYSFRSPDELIALVDEAVENGDYYTRSEAIRAALRREVYVDA